MLDSIIHASEFFLIFVLVCILLAKTFRYIRTMTFTKDGVSVKFDFYIDTKNEPANPNEWKVIDVDNINNTLSLDDFKYFVTNNVWKQIPISENDRNNFRKINELLSSNTLGTDEIVRKYWQRNYLFNIKFSMISRLVKEYKQTWREVLLRSENELR